MSFVLILFMLFFFHQFFKRRIIELKKEIKLVKFLCEEEHPFTLGIR